MSTLKIIPLGGQSRAGGPNCFYVECRDFAVIIDAGMSFPGRHYPGVSSILPNLHFLNQRQVRRKLKAVFTTHGHLDHIGAVPNMLQGIPGVFEPFPGLPVIGTSFTGALLGLRWSRQQNSFGTHFLCDDEGLRVQAFKFRPDSSLAGFLVETSKKVLTYIGDVKLLNVRPFDPENYLRGLSRQADLLLNFTKMDPGQEIENWGPFVSVRPFSVAHSVPGSVGLCFETKSHILIHSGDFRRISSSALQRLGEHAVKVNKPIIFLVDATGAAQPGIAPKEGEILSALEQIFEKNKDCRIFFAAFSSHVARLQMAIDLAEKYGRKVAVVGSSVEAVIELASKRGYLNTKGILIAMEKAKRLPGNQLLVIVSGTQFEGFNGRGSVLHKLAFGRHRDFVVKQGDCIIISASVIPGSDERVQAGSNRLAQLGAMVFYEGGRHGFSSIHTSGHGNQENIDQVFKALVPTGARVIVFPASADLQSRQHLLEIAAANGVDKNDVILAEDNQVIEIEGCQFKISRQSALGGDVCLNSQGGIVNSRIIRTSRRLVQGGAVFISLLQNPRTKRVIGKPNVNVVGFRLPQKDFFEMLDIIKERTNKYYASRNLKEDIIREVADFVGKKRGGKRPHVVCQILQGQPY